MSKIRDGDDLGVAGCVDMLVHPDLAVEAVRLHGADNDRGPGARSRFSVREAMTPLVERATMSA